MAFCVGSGTPRNVAPEIDLSSKIVAPLEVRQRILQSLHNSPSGGHLGRNKTLGRVRHRFYWPRYKEHVILWCRRCDVCARSKPGPRRRRAKLGHVSVGAPLERVAVDIMGPLPKTDNDNEYLLVVGDYFTNRGESFPLKNHTAQTVADVMVEEFVALRSGTGVWVPVDCWIVQTLTGEKDQDSAI